jgi:membrane protein YqaA with SNARE-associated domain
MSPLLGLFLVIFLLNVIPAFAPPTWMVFSFLGFRLPSQMGWTFALVGAAAATTGRFLLGKLSRRIVRNQWLSDTTRENVNSIKIELERRPKMTFAVLLFYAFTPLPSNYLFIAYGLTALPFIHLVCPFFVGRFVSHYFWTMGGVVVSRRLELENTDATTYFGVYFVLTQFALLGLVYVFTRVDWKYLLQHKKWQWLPKSSSNAT